MNRLLASFRLGVILLGIGAVALTPSPASAGYCILTCRTCTCSGTTGLCDCTGCWWFCSGNPLRA